jgi:hypothetical protein
MEQNNGCAFGRETRQMTINIKDDIKEIKEAAFDLRNHYSQRLPTWASVAISILLGLLGAVIALKLS